MYWAHSDPDRSPEEEGSRWQPLAEHLQAVARIARSLAETATEPGSSLGDLAFRCGMLHDFGKYQSCFQQMLQGIRRSCPHSLYGAIALRQFEGAITGQDRRWLLPAVCAVAAHHAGLKNWSDHAAETKPGLPDHPDREVAERLTREAFADHPEIRRALEMPPPGADQGTLDLRTRMLLSCLVDADRLNTAGLSPTQQELGSSAKLAQLTHHLAAIAESARQRGSSPELIALRDEVQLRCAERAQAQPGLFSLCVPTGGGKTLAAMRFALEHAAAHSGALSRVIVVIPYLSIIEQNAQVYSDVFGPEAVFEHHSGAVHSLRSKDGRFRPQPESEAVGAEPWRRVETENWDAPLIVTTSVRFFESLFSNHPSDLRRIHNIARSVIVLDEVQTLPRRLLAPLLGMLCELTTDWGCSVVLSTATQPAFEAPAHRPSRFAWPAETVTPIVPAERTAAMSQKLKRVRIEWELRATVSWEALASRVGAHPQALCVVNLRDHASALFDVLSRMLGEDQVSRSIFHLSTRMCAAHRLDELAIIRERLAQALPCRIVSTQLVEAGVDLDVPMAFRALGPLDSIVQVAGRVDREGRMTAVTGEPAGRLVVFVPEQEKYPGGDYKGAAEVTRGLLDEFEDVQTCDLPRMREFFDRYYGLTDDRGRGQDLAAMRQGAAPQFRTLAEQFEMIESRTRSVFVPYGEGIELLSVLERTRVLDRALLRKLQRYTVGLQPYEFEAGKTQGLYELWEGSDLWRNGQMTVSKGSLICSQA